MLHNAMDVIFFSMLLLELNFYHRFLLSPTFPFENWIELCLEKNHRISQLNDVMIQIQVLKTKLCFLQCTQKKLILSIFLGTCNNQNRTQRFSQRKINIFQVNFSLSLSFVVELVPLLFYPFIHLLPFKYNTQYCCIDRKIYKNILTT
jgi:hypothetical protein